MLFTILATALISSTLSVEASTPPKKIITRIVEPKDYAVKRFQEVVEDSTSYEDESNQEKLIAARARLAVSERELEQLKTGISRSTPPTDPAEKDEGPKPQVIRASTARVDHYRKLVAELEAQTLASVRKEREKSKKGKFRAKAHAPDQ